jgi:hypothetical protein
MVAELTSREIAPWYFNHAGNAGTAYLIAAASSYAVALVTRRNNADTDPFVKESISTGSGLMAGVAITAVIESPYLNEQLDRVSDPNDIIFGVAGAIIGATTLSIRRMDANDRSD